MSEIKGEKNGKKFELLFTLPTCYYCSLFNFGIGFRSEYDFGRLKEKQHFICQKTAKHSYNENQNNRYSGKSTC